MGNIPALSLTRVLPPDGAIKTFQTLARDDRAGALSLANTMQPKEIGIAAALGVYSSTQR